MAERYHHIAAYKFVDWGDLPQRRKVLRELCAREQLRGTILLSHEGINLFVAGTPPAVERLLTFLTAEPSLRDMPVKRSEVDRQPYRRMLVKIKPEIISMGQPDIRPARHTSPRVTPQELCRWLDEGRPITLLDVRNRYEVALGSFLRAVCLPIDHFRQFPQACRDLTVPRDSTLVTFCTGGIRCEKAAPVLEQLGYRDVYQLDGGILQYFAECRDRHFAGECFVFDDRVAIDGRLRETRTVQCYACQSPLTREDQASEFYVPGRSCPHCFRSDAEQQRDRIARRQQRLARGCHPLPGSLPYANVRPIRVGNLADGQPLLAFLDGKYPFVGRERWEQRCQGGWVRRDGRPLAAHDTVRAGDRLEHVMPDTVEPAVNADIRILYEDASIVVVQKPAPLPMHPCGRYNRNTLIHLLAQVYRPEKIRIAHRLDANTSGVVVFSRNARTARALQPQFEQGGVRKCYLLRVQGVFPAEEIVCEASIGKQLAAAGARGIEPNGMAAHTLFRRLEVFDDGTSLVEARPRTGRTNQIRIHAWHLRFPICGDPMYLPQHTVQHRQTLLPSEPTMCLLAWRLTFAHPQTGDEVTFEADRPGWSLPNTAAIDLQPSGHPTEGIR